MAGPLNGLGSGQQVPLSNTFQPGRNADQVRPDNDNREKDDKNVRSRGSAAETQNAETGNQDAARNAAFSAEREKNDDEDNQKKKRGSLVDLTV